MKLSPCELKPVSAGQKQSLALACPCWECFKRAPELGVVDPGTQEAEAGLSLSLSQFGLPRELQDSQGYPARLCLKGGGGGDPWTSSLTLIQIIKGMTQRAQSELHCRHLGRV